MTDHWLESKVVKRKDRNKPLELWMMMMLQLFQPSKKLDRKRKEVVLYTTTSRTSRYHKGRQGFKCSWLCQQLSTAKLLRPHRSKSCLKPLNAPFLFLALALTGPSSFSTLFCLALRRKSLASKARGCCKEPNWGYIIQYTFFWPFPPSLSLSLAVQRLSGLCPVARAVSRMPLTPDIDFDQT